MLLLENDQKNDNKIYQFPLFISQTFKRGGYKILKVRGEGLDFFVFLRKVRKQGVVIVRTLSTKMYAKLPNLVLRS